MEEELLVPQWSWLGFDKDSARWALSKLLRSCSFGVNGVSLLQWRSGGLECPTLRRFTLSRRQQLSRIILVSARVLDRGVVLFVYFVGGSNLAKMPVHKLLHERHAVEF